MKNRMTRVQMFLFFAAVVLIGLNAFMVIRWAWTQEDDIGVRVGSSNDQSNCADMPPITDLTKQEAFGILRDSFSADEFLMLCDFLPDNMKDSVRSTFYVASADEDGKQILVEAGSPVLWEGFGEVVSEDKSDDRFIVVRGKLDSSDEKVDTLVLFHDRDLSVRRYYGDYVWQEITFHKKDRDYVENAMKVFARAGAPMFNILTLNLYSYDVEETTEEFIFGYYYVSLGSGYTDEMGITLNKAEHRVNKESGVMTAENNDYGETLKSFEMTEEEYEEIVELFGALAGDS